MRKAFLEGMEAFDRIIPGFADDAVCLSGVESRTSSPVRIPRDETLQSSVRGLYPCGEGAGYAGGITSAAMDGMRVAEAIAARYQIFKRMSVKRFCVEETMEQYRSKLKDKKRIVVKIGSSSLQHPQTGELDYIKLEVLVRELCNLRNQGKDVVLVTSGAIAQGRRAMHLSDEDFSQNRIAMKQACAAIRPGTADDDL